jgi:hypothetical protein
MTDNQRAQVLHTRLLALQAMAREGLDPTEEKTNKAQQNAILGELEKLSAGTPATTGTATAAGGEIKVRDKKTGKTGKWVGGGTPPADQYEIVK